ncbi:MAG: DUF3047 domain-containing protein [Candidatus Sulfobium sp.]
MRKSVCFLAVLIALSWTASAALASRGAVVRENFANLGDWKPLRFDNTKKNTSYSEADEDGIACLKARSVGSSSAIVCNTEFNVYRYPLVRWKWKVSNIYAKGDIGNRKENDSPARLYVMFKYNPERAGFFTKLKYSIAKKIYGRYPPRYALCYVWANRRHRERIITSPGFGDIKYVVLEAGNGEVGRWREEEVNVLQDFKEAFGKMPPAIADISFMDDSDDTGGRSTAWLASLKVMRQVPSFRKGIAASLKDKAVGP